MSKLNDMYVKLSTDPETWEKLRKSPEEVIDSFGLSADEKNLVMNGPADDLRSALGMSGRSNFVIW